ncbi:MAG TPA: DNA gyrase subunit A [Candidatus Pelethosoma merdigallinarum]|nr:DNA gyrase subunit A [Candidatus Pelethosoma merdigallinarum]
MDQIQERQFTEEVKKSFINYAMSVIVARALPDARDGLKPVQRRIVHGMNDLGATVSSPYKKCARIIGEVMGKYHPHGDSSIYEALVRMAQDFSYRYMIVDGHGNFGSIDGDGAAAQRYTEARMSKISMELVRDINKNTVNFIPNYDGEEKEPEVLPARFPNLLVNGSTGIAVGMATNIPPHNLGETIDGVIALIDNPDITIDELMEKIKGPDFPTGAIILGNSGIKKAYETGKGIITVRSRAEIHEVKPGKSQIIVTEIPYMVNKARMIERIANLVKEKVLDGITDLRDESNREGIRIVIELRRDVNPNVLLNNLYKHTDLQTSYGINSLALVDGAPRILSLKEMLEVYLNHQREVIIRRTQFDLDKAEARVHILEGLKIALDNIDEIVQLLKKAKNDQEATEQLISRFKLTEIQAKAILEMRLRRLTGLEREKIESELKELEELIAELKSILASSEKVLAIIKEELTEIKNKYGDERRTSIDMSAIDYIEDESLIPVENIVVTLTNKGYIKRVTTETYRSQNRGGVGVKGMSTNEEDFVENMISMTTHDYLLFFTNKGKVYRIKGYEVPLYGRQSKGLPIINLLPIEKDEVVKVMLKVENEEQSRFIVFCTQNGVVKRTDIKEFDNIRKSGKIAITLRDGDELIAAKKTSGNSEILIAASNGRMVRFDESEARVMGRSASGVKGIDIENGICVGCEVSDENQQILVVTEKGYGKKTDLSEYRKTHRGSKGVKALNITDKNGNLVAFKTVHGDEDLMIMTNSGVIIRLPLEQVSTTGRVAQGVRLIHLKDDQMVSTVTTIQKEVENIESEEE